MTVARIGQELVGAGAAVLANALIQIDPQSPTVDPEAQAALKEAKTALEAEAPHGAAPDPNEEALAARAAAKLKTPAL